VRRLKRGFAAVVLVLIAGAAFARIGGGHTYSGGSSSSSGGSSSGSHSGGSSGGSYSGGSGSSSSGSGYSSGGGSEADSGCVFAGFVAMLVIFFVVAAIQNSQAQQELTITSATGPEPDRSYVRDMSVLRRYDANFSEIVFTDFCYSLFARVHDARGRGRLDDYAPYVSSVVREGLKRRSAATTSVSEIVIGSFAILSLHGVETSLVKVEVQFEANFTEVMANGPCRWYIVERWTLERARDILSPAPERARAMHCPKCGAPLETRTDGGCLHCGALIRDGRFHWFVRSVTTVRKDLRPPSLTGGGVESGTTSQTIYDRSLPRSRTQLVEYRPDFSWSAFDERVRFVAQALQDAWTSRDWQKARPLETDALFQMHRYWIDEYLRQDLRNAVDQFAIDTIYVVKVMSDAFYDSITVRMYASGFDYTVDAHGAVVGGSPAEERRWSEYWTFVCGSAAVSAEARVCPNCGGELAEGETAICEYCGGKVTTGEFPWVLSRIEQDESYRG
jgi:hypothetical protein